MTYLVSLITFDLYKEIGCQNAPKNFFSKVIFKSEYFSLNEI